MYEQSGNRAIKMRANERSRARRGSRRGQFMKIDDLIIACVYRHSEWQTHIVLYTVTHIAVQSAYTY